MPDTATLLSFFHNPYPGKVSGMEAPQQLSRQAVEDFKAIYRDEFGEDIADDEAQEIALRLLRLFDLLLQPLPGDLPGQNSIPKPHC